MYSPLRANLFCNLILTKTFASHGQQEADIECYSSPTGIAWTKLSTVTGHVPKTIRMNHAAGIAKNGDIVVLCSGWTDVKQETRPKQAAFRDAIMRSWVLRSRDAGSPGKNVMHFPQEKQGGRNISRIADPSCVQDITV